jgi:3-phosphoshikimate 1-carboxyvinyltransferase
MSEKIYTISRNTSAVKAQIKLVSSKSESNRALIINAVSGGKCELDNLSAARDTQTMQRLLGLSTQELDVLDAGTTMRFLTAYTAIKGLDKVMTGTPRMCERPIGILVEALKSVGCNVTYLKNEGFPPLKIDAHQGLTSNRITMKGDVSSQYISAILMNAPLFENGLILALEGKIASRPYLEMTLQLMKHFGVQSEWKANEIHIAPHQQYNTQRYSIESDWSGASYWYSIAALGAEGTEIEVLGLKADSLQGDSVLVNIMEPLGVKSTFNERGVVLTKIPHQQEVKIDFSDCPDIAQTLSVVAAAKHINLTLTGLESLRIKETDRILAIQQELRKFGADMKALEEDLFIIEHQNFNVNNQLVDTYDDHRMAMAFAPLALIGKVRIENPDVVNKSYPSYWDDLSIAGFDILS